MERAEELRCCSVFEKLDPRIGCVDQFLKLIRGRERDAISLMQPIRNRRKVSFVIVIE